MLEEKMQNSFKKGADIFMRIDLFSIPFLFLLAIFSPMIFASGSNLSNYLFIYSIFSLLFIVILVLIFSWIYYRKGKFKQAFFISVSPFILLVIFILIGMLSDYFKFILSLI